MDLPIPASPKFSVTPTGLAIAGSPGFDEWLALAPVLGEASKGIAFAIGDWLAYGKRYVDEGGASETPRVGSVEYDAAASMTGLDRSTLHTYAHVARKVAQLDRRSSLSWEHHKVVAKLPPAGQRRWLDIAEGDRKRGRPMSARRLRLSIQAGRALTAGEMSLPAADRGIDNHIPMVNGLVSWWSRMGEGGWIEGATAEERAAIKRDLEPLVSIYEQL